MHLTIPNQLGEQLDTYIEGSSNSNQLIVFVHGFGTDKDENGLFLDLAQSLRSNFLTLRFDAAGWGESQGNQQDFSFIKQANDLESVLIWSSKEYPRHNISLIAHSGGVHATLFLKPAIIAKAIFTALPHSSGQDALAFIQERLVKKGGKLNPLGISTFPRSGGMDNHLGPVFWESLRKLKTASNLREFAKHTQVLAIHPTSDEIVSSKYVSDFRQIRNVQFQEIPGDHGFTSPKDRKNLIINIQKFLES